MITPNYFFSGINRYFSKIFLMWIGACIAIISFVITLGEFTEYNRRAARFSKIHFVQILELIVLKLPNFLQLQLPLVILLAAIITFWRLNRTTEIVVARSFGVSLWQITTGLSAVVLVVSAINLAVINPLAAAFTQKQQDLEKRLFSKQEVALTIAENGVWLREKFAERQSIIHIQKVDMVQRVFTGFTMQNISANNEFISRIDAETAVINNGSWQLKSVSIFRPRAEKQTLTELSIETDLTFSRILKSNQEPQMISFWRLPYYIDLLERSGLSSLPYRMYWHSLIAKMGMMVAMVFLSAAFCIRPVRQGFTSLLVVFAILSGFVIYFLNDLIYAMGMAERLPILLANWALVLVIALLSVTLILHQEEG